MTWVLVLVMLQGAYAWPETFPTEVACRTQGDKIMAGQTDVTLVDAYSCKEE